MNKKYGFKMAALLVLLCSGCGTFQANPHAQDRKAAAENAEKETEEQKTEEQKTEEQKAEEQKTEKQKIEEQKIEEQMNMKISVKSTEYEIIYELNGSQAAQDLYGQLPLTLEVKDFSTNEKTFYPPRELDISDAPMADADKGTLAYYSPWADVVMFYDYFGKGNSLYELGEAVSGKEEIEKLSGQIEVTAIEE